MLWESGHCIESDVVMLPWIKIAESERRWPRFCLFDEMGYDIEVDAIDLEPGQLAPAVYFEEEKSGNSATSAGYQPHKTSTSSAQLRDVYMPTWVGTLTPYR